MEIPIVIAAFNRALCLNRLLQSLSRAKFDNEVKLIISIDGGGPTDVLEISEKFKWRYGTKELIYHESNSGLRDHILFCGSLSSKYDGIIQYEGSDCHKVTMIDKNYKIVDYTVLEGESLRKIAQKLLLDEYKLIELNGSSVEAGQVIKVPSTFCKEILVYVDVKTSLPMYMKVWDEIGMVGEYAYHNLIINPTFAADEFSEDGSMY